MSINTTEETQKYIEYLEQENKRLLRTKTLSSPAYPYNAWISDNEITFSYDESQHKPLAGNDKMVFTLKTISLDRFKEFVRSHAMDLGLYPWVCSEGGDGYFSTVIDYELYGQCFTVNLSKCLHKLIESDNELKLSFLQKETREYYERNR